MAPASETDGSPRLSVPTSGSPAGLRARSGSGSVRARSRTPSPFNSSSPAPVPTVPVSLGMSQGSISTMPQGRSVSNSPTQLDAPAGGGGDGGAGASIPPLPARSGSSAAPGRLPDMLDVSAFLTPSMATGTGGGGGNGSASVSPGLAGKRISISSAISEGSLSGFIDHMAMSMSTVPDALGAAGDQTTPQLMNLSIGGEAPAAAGLGSSSHIPRASGSDVASPRRPSPLLKRGGPRSGLRELTLPESTDPSPHSSPTRRVTFLKQWSGGGGPNASFGGASFASHGSFRHLGASLRSGGGADSVLGMSFSSRPRGGSIRSGYSSPAGDEETDPRLVKQRYEESLRRRNEQIVAISQRALAEVNEREHETQVLEMRLAAALQDNQSLKAQMEMMSRMDPDAQQREDDYCNIVEENNALRQKLAEQENKAWAAQRVEERLDELRLQEKAFEEQTIALKEKEEDLEKFIEEKATETSTDTVNQARKRHLTVLAITKVMYEKRIKELTDDYDATCNMLIVDIEQADAMVETLRGENERLTETVADLETAKERLRVELDEAVHEREKAAAAHARELRAADAAAGDLATQVAGLEAELTRAVQAREAALTDVAALETKLRALANDVEAGVDGKAALEAALSAGDAAAATREAQAAEEYEREHAAHLRTAAQLSEVQTELAAAVEAAAAEAARLSARIAEMDVAVEASTVARDAMEQRAAAAEEALARATDTLGSETTRLTQLLSDKVQELLDVEAELAGSRGQLAKAEAAVATMREREVRAVAATPPPRARGTPLTEGSPSFLGSGAVLDAVSPPQAPTPTRHVALEAEVARLQRDLVEERRRGKQADIEHDRAAGKWRQVLDAARRDGEHHAQRIAAMEATAEKTAESFTAQLRAKDEDITRLRGSVAEAKADLVDQQAKLREVLRETVADSTAQTKLLQEELRGHREERDAAVAKATAEASTLWSDVERLAGIEHTLRTDLADLQQRFDALHGSCEARVAVAVRAMEAARAAQDAEVTARARAVADLHDAHHAARRAAGTEMDALRLQLEEAEVRRKHLEGHHDMVAALVTTHVAWLMMKVRLQGGGGGVDAPLSISIKPRNRDLTTDDLRAENAKLAAIVRSTQREAAAAQVVLEEERTRATADHTAHVSAVRDLEAKLHDAQRRAANAEVASAAAEVALGHVQAAAKEGREEAAALKSAAAANEGRERKTAYDLQRAAADIERIRTQRDHMAQQAALHKAREEARVVELEALKEYWSGMHAALLRLAQQHSGGAHALAAPAGLFDSRASAVLAVRASFEASVVDAMRNHGAIYTYSRSPARLGLEQRMQSPSVPLSMSPETPSPAGRLRISTGDRGVLQHTVPVGSPHLLESSGTATAPPVPPFDAEMHGDGTSPAAAGEVAAARETAGALYKAMKGWGTDEDAVYSALGRIASVPAWHRVVAAFCEHHGGFHGGDLLGALRDELSGDEFNRCAAILLDTAGVEDPTATPLPPRAIADKLHAAMKGWGTDEDGVYRVLGRVADAAAWYDTQRLFKEHYPTFYDGDVVKALHEELTGAELAECTGILGRRSVALARDTAGASSPSSPGSPVGATVTPQVTDATSATPGSLVLPHIDIAKPNSAGGLAAGGGVVTVASPQEMQPPQPQQMPSESPAPAALDINVDPRVTRLLSDFADALRRICGDPAGDAAAAFGVVDLPASTAGDADAGDHALLEAANEKIARLEREAGRLAAEYERVIAAAEQQRGIDKRAREVMGEEVAALQTEVNAARGEARREVAAAGELRGQLEALQTEQRARGDDATAARERVRELQVEVADAERRVGEAEATGQREVAKLKASCAAETRGLGEQLRAAENTIRRLQDEARDTAARRIDAEAHAHEALATATANTARWRDLAETAQGEADALRRAQDVASAGTAQIAADAAKEREALRTARARTALAEAASAKLEAEVLDARRQVGAAAQLVTEHVAAAHTAYASLRAEEMAAFKSYTLQLHGGLAAAAERAATAGAEAQRRGSTPSPSVRPPSPAVGAPLLTATQLQEVTAALTEAEVRERELLADIAALQAAAGAAQAELQRRDVETAAARETGERLRRDLTESDARVRGLAADVSLLQSQLDEALARVVEMDAAVQTKEAVLRACEDGHARKDADAAAQRRKIAELEGRLDAAEAAADLSRRQAAVAQGDADAAKRAAESHAARRADLEDVARQVEESGAVAARLRGDLTDARAEARAARADLRRLRQEHTALIEASGVQEAAAGRRHQELLLKITGLEGQLAAAHAATANAAVATSPPRAPAPAPHLTTLVRTLAGENAQLREALRSGGHGRAGGGAAAPQVVDAGIVAMPEAVTPPAAGAGVPGSTGAAGDANRGGSGVSHGPRTPEEIVVEHAVTTPTPSRTPAAAVAVSRRSPRKPSLVDTIPQRDRWYTPLRGAPMPVVPRRGRSVSPTLVEDAGAPARAHAAADAVSVSNTVRGLRGDVSTTLAVPPSGGDAADGVVAAIEDKLAARTPTLSPDNRHPSPPVNTVVTDYTSSGASARPYGSSAAAWTPRTGSPTQATALSAVSRPSVPLAVRSGSRSPSHPPSQRISDILSPASAGTEFPHAPRSRQDIPPVSMPATALASVPETMSIATPLTPLGFGEARGSGVGSTGISHASVVSLASSAGGARRGSPSAAAGGMVAVSTLVEAELGKSPVLMSVSSPTSLTPALSQRAHGGTLPSRTEKQVSISAERTVYSPTATATSAPSSASDVLDGTASAASTARGSMSSRTTARTVTSRSTTISDASSAEAPKDPASAVPAATSPVKKYFHDPCRRGSGSGDGAGYSGGGGPDSTAGRSVSRSPASPSSFGSRSWSTGRDVDLPPRSSRAATTSRTTYDLKSGGVPPAMHAAAPRASPTQAVSAMPSFGPNDGDTSTATRPEQQAAFRRTLSNTDTDPDAAEYKRTTTMTSMTTRASTDRHGSPSAPAPRAAAPITPPSQAVSAMPSLGVGDGAADGAAMSMRTTSSTRVGLRVGCPGDIDDGGGDSLAAVPSFSSSVRSDLSKATAAARDPADATGQASFVPTPSSMESHIDGFLDDFGTLGVRARLGENPTPPRTTTAAERRAADTDVSAVTTATTSRMVEQTASSSAGGGTRATPTGATRTAVTTDDGEEGADRSFGFNAPPRDWDEPELPTPTSRRGRDASVASRLRDISGLRKEESQMMSTLRDLEGSEGGTASRVASVDADLFEAARESREGSDILGVPRAASSASSK